MAVTMGVTLAHYFCTLLYDIGIIIFMRSTSNASVTTSKGYYDESMEGNSESNGHV